MLILDKIVLTKIFEEAFGIEVLTVNSEGSSGSFAGYGYLMEYDFLEGYICFTESSRSDEIGIIFTGEYIFSEIDPSNNSSQYVKSFEFMLKKYINSNKKKFRRKFISRWDNFLL